MKTPVYIFLFLLIMQLCPMQLQSQTQAQATVYNGLVNIKQNKAEVEHGRLKLDMDLLLSGVSVGRYQTLLLTPVLRNGNHSFRFAPVRINGVNKQKMYERTIAFEGKRVADGDAYVVLKSNPSLLQEVNYKKVIPFQPWMEEAELILIGELNNYDDIPVQTYTNILTDHFYIQMAE
ncbi:DUF3868 domain-containing protein [Parabacteroides faecis]|uniref:DUF3868 domain-containing protein n=1 Tax=Parabacteroides faecis TaxID=1217282 RepID=UPI002164E400|nr:DUF3868 domain-containing protein [Parabacteroides faecis]MCS2890212.1 DUF3868 domain-containing protein [Parabacteroides faecis]UVQ46094.1 DUF3868 domain-containing protein [Parabacteroides faecis]